MADTLKEKIEKLSPWLMRHELEPGVYTEVAPGSAGANQKDFFDEKGKLIIAFLKKLYGGNLSGRTVSDIGCASGFFSFKALEAGADFVKGIDARQIHIDQANFLAGHFGYKNCCFQKLRTDQMLEGKEAFDCILFMDLLQMLPNPIQVMEYLSRVTRQVLILDVALYKRPKFSFIWPEFESTRRDVMILSDESGKSHNKYGVDKLAILPTYSAVITLLKNHGFKDIFHLFVPRKWKNEALPLLRYVDGKYVILAAIKDKALLSSVDLSKCAKVSFEPDGKMNYSTWGPKFRYIV